ncbi:MAG: HlyD family efflux transporter periplasmic adaptor subunit [Syntrophobacteraceae bacterium]
MDSAEQNQNSVGKRSKKLRIGASVVLITVVLGVAYWFLFLRHRVTTENAYVVADSAAISSRVAGTILKKQVDNDNRVVQGDVLLELDPADFQAVVERSRAAVARLDAEIQVAEVSIQLIDVQTRSQVQAAEAALQLAQDKEREARFRIEERERLRIGAEADLSHAKRDLDRYSNLLQEGASSEQQRDRTSTSFKKAKSQVEAADAQVGGSRASLAAAVQEVDRARAQLDTFKGDLLRREMERHKLAAQKARRAELQAELETAELNRSYCTIRASITGFVAQSRIQVGERVQPGQSLMAIVPLQDVYVEANLKETQLEDVRIGQKVTIAADTFPGHVYRGHVAGIRAGTGAAFSLLPPENATGNWIKVVQRIPVKILLDQPPPQDYPLRVGASLHVTIDTTDRSGARLVTGKTGQAERTSADDPGRE